MRKGQALTLSLGRDQASMHLKTGLRKVVIIFHFKILISKNLFTKVEITLFFQCYLPIGNREISVMIRSLSFNHYLLKE